MYEAGCNHPIFEVVYGYVGVVSVTDEFYLKLSRDANALKFGGKLMAAPFNCRQ